jgi:hypothetical protein
MAEDTTSIHAAGKVKTDVEDGFLSERMLVVFVRYESSLIFGFAIPG